MTLNELVHKALMMGIGIPEKINELVDELVQKGELSESQGARIIRECSEKVGKSGDELSRSVSEFVSKALEKMNVPTGDDIEKLNRKVSALSSRVKKLEGASQDAD